MQTELVAFAIVCFLGLAVNACGAWVWSRAISSAYQARHLGLQAHLAEREAAGVEGEDIGLPPSAPRMNGKPTDFEIAEFARMPDEGFESTDENEHIDSRNDLDVEVWKRANPVE